MSTTSVMRQIWRIRITRSVRTKTTSAIENVPFELDASTDDKYKTFNNMYVDMFTKADLPAYSTRKAETMSELEELNNEMSELYDIPVLKPGELSTKTKKDGRFILRSTSTDPYFNLALEDYIFQHSPLNQRQDVNKKDLATVGNERLLFYTNDKSVVIGKNQNPWKELYLRNIADRQYEYVRRKSGGGAVVHDLGNVNYSYLTSRERFDRLFFNKQLVRWLAPYNNTVQLNERGDITLGSKKVSGSAFKIGKGKAYHHGTMLVSSDLAQFSGLLKPKDIPGIRWDCRSVESVRSQVQNLQGHCLDTIDEFCQVVVSGYRQMLQEDVPLYYCNESSATTEILAYAEELKSFQWKFMSSPKFTVHLGDISILVEKGIVIQSDLPGTTGLTFYEFVNNLNNNCYNSFIDYKL
ncbi:AFR609Cp [Eremothecium gossypii ATCC 10895]|uniref:Putative lipoate-protein ligase A n=1 Tax=Eremothecium gossypii (strain ATCC 10895 / CBS 109.51 / FGSC 9923 / NRRL Y-1056) TaxID=284811 RepID=Q752G7_EREGS|nr:AFR609Cp [Eremothecium gossypii ATCC 10895]AAS53980.1 AFR609Cp [Eremothecium gossypii ATCC 10895]AEY98294.1 FAFR609Cp [Eremothecium gossypii FDAG1]